MTFIVAQANSQHIPLADESVQCVVTSPPYFALRDYGVDGQLGLEPTPEAYVANLVAVFREVRRVLRPDGVVWLNLGSSYASATSRQSQSRPALHEPAYGSDGREPSDYQETDPACHRCDGERPGDYPNHPNRSSHNGQAQHEAAVLLCTTGRDSGHPGSAAASLGVSVLGVPASTIRLSSRQPQGASCPEATASVCQPSPRTCVGDAPQCVGRAGSKRDKSSQCETLADHRLDTGLSSEAPSTSDGSTRDSITTLFRDVHFKPKDLVPIPWMVAMALQQDGWYLRSDCIWAKPNCMPSSVKDRPTSSHEYVFLLTKSARYYWDGEAVKEPSVYPNDNRKARSKTTLKRMPTDTMAGVRPGSATYPTRNRRTVWSIATEPYEGSHFAVMPTKLVEPCILAGTSERGCCPVCGAPWERVVEKGDNRHWTERRGERDKWALGSHPGGRNDGGGSFIGSDLTTIGWRPTCDHDAEPVPCTVLDPFAGSGTVGVVALRHGRRFVGLDLSRAYCEMARRRIVGDMPILHGMVGATCKV